MHDMKKKPKAFVNSIYRKLKFLTSLTQFDVICSSQHLRIECAKVSKTCKATFSSINIFRKILLCLECIKSNMYRTPACFLLNISETQTCSLVLNCLCYRVEEFHKDLICTNNKMEESSIKTKLILAAKQKMKLEWKHFESNRPTSPRTRLEARTIL